MDLVTQQIKDQLGEFSKQFGPAAIMPAVVTAVNADSTVSVEFSDGSTVEDVRLKSIVKEGNQFLLIPKIGSCVLIGKIQNSDEYVLLVVDEITEVKSVIDSVTQSIDTAGFLFQKGTDTLKDALVTFVEAVEAIVVIEGRNPDRLKLAAAKTKIQNILR